MERQNRNRNAPSSRLISDDIHLDGAGRQEADGRATSWPMATSCTMSTDRLSGVDELAINSRAFFGELIELMMKKFALFMQAAGRPASDSAPSQSWQATWRGKFDAVLCRRLSEAESANYSHFSFTFVAFECGAGVCCANEPSLELRGRIYELAQVVS